MRLFTESGVVDRRPLRVATAALVTVAAIGAFVTRSDQVLSWIFLGPTVALFWLWALCRWPLGSLTYAAGLSVPLILNLAESEAEVSMFIAVFTAAALAFSKSDRGWMRASLMVFLFVMVLFGVTGAIHDFAWPNWLVGTIFAWGTGEFIWRFTETVDELEHTRSLVADQAVLEERRRIARDVHDLVGHSLSVVLMHVTGARHLVHTDPDEAERALEQAETAGRESLAEIRRTVGLLRDQTDPDEPPIPSPDLNDVPSLVDDFANAGLLVRLEQRGPLDNVNPTTSLAAYRIIQEALTNASRHTVGADVSVSIDVGQHRCGIVVANRGGDMIEAGHRAGFGLVSMRERASSVGGSLLAGPSADGWSVDATFPVEAAPSAPGAVSAPGAPSTTGAETVETVESKP